MQRFLKRSTPLQISLLIGLLAVVTFAPFAGNEFVALDDDYLIYNNPAVTKFSWAGLKHVFSSFDPQLYIPLTFLSFQINAALFGVNSTAFHLTNILLHAANAALVFIILRRLCGNTLIALVTAALFAVHPLQTEAVLWAAGRKDTLSGFFCLLSVLWYLKYRESTFPRPLPLALSIVFFGAGLMAKVSIIALPVWLLLIDWVQRRSPTKRMFAEKIAYFALAVVFGTVAIIGKMRIFGEVTQTENLLLPLKSATFYLTKIFQPWGFSVMYLYHKGLPFIVDFGPSLLILFLIAGVFGWALWKKRRLFAFFIATYFVLLAPSFSNAVKGGHLYVASDRYAYLACIGIFAIIAGSLDELQKTLRKKSMNESIAPVLAGILIIALIPLSWLQAGTWRTSETLYRNVIALYPKTPMAYVNLGVALQQKGNLAQAKELYTKALELDPEAVHAYFNLANVLGKEGKEEEAQKLYVEIVNHVETQPITNSNELKPFLWLVEKLERIGKPADAERLFEKIQQKFSHFPDPHGFLGLRFFSEGKKDAALEELLQARDLGSDDPKVYMALAQLLSEKNRREETIDAIKAVIRLDPNNGEAKTLLRRLQM